MNDDRISREDLLKELSVVQNRPVSTAMKIIRGMPRVQPEQKIAHWIFTDKCNEHAKCSNCGYGDIDLMIGEIHNFCQCCGAKFEGNPEPYKETE